MGSKVTGFAKGDRVAADVGGMSFNPNNTDAQRPVHTVTTVDEERSYSVNTSPPPVSPEMVVSPTTSSSKLAF